MALDLERQQAKLIEQIAAKATASSARQLAGLVTEATCDSRLIAFPKLLALPFFYKLVDTEYASSLDLLRLFAYGTWEDYKDNSNTFPALGYAQIAKLKQLTMLTLAQSRKTLTYDQLKNMLDFSNVEDLEHFLESCNNSGILIGKLNKQEQCFQVLYTLDAYEKSRGKLLLDKSFDIFLEEAKKNETGSKPGQMCNGIVMQVHIPFEVSCCKSELRSRMSRLFIMLLQHVTNAHAKGLSFDGHIYTAMFVVVGDQLLLRPEASAKTRLTCDNFVKDRKSVASILRRYTGLKMHYFDAHGVEKNILYPMYMMDLINHLEGAISNLHPDHASSPLTMASDEGYILFLLCHPTFLSDAARSVLFWYVRTYEKSINEDDRMSFKSAMEQIFIKVKWFDLKDHRLFKNVFGYADSVNNSYKDDPVNCFRLIRDWELHLPTYLTEKEREIYTAAVINYLIEHYFDDFLPQTMYHLLCTYSKEDTKFDLKDWIQRLQQVSMEEANFLMMDWDKVGVHGLLPTDVITQQQIGTMAIELEKLRHNPIDGPYSSVSLAKWRALNMLRWKNETIYYQVLAENIEEYEPIVYTPTVGIVCQKSSGMIQSSWGLYLSADDQGYMFSVMNKSLANQVDVIVVTDGSRVLGFDDLGVKGIGMVIGKLDLYVAAAGINPQRVLPVMIDVGTNNEKLLKDPVYHGMQTHRLDDEEFHVVVDNFVSAIFSRWPKVIMQFEGFEYKRAFRLLDRYRTTNRVFNDDIQGTAGVALAGLLGAVRAQGKNIVDFPSQKIVVAGSESSWIGVVNAASLMMARILGNSEGSIESARCQFWIVDADGLMTEERTCIAPDAHPFARRKSEVDHQGPHEGATLFQVVKKVKPDMLLGLSAVGGLFSKEVLEALKDSSSSRPAVFVMSSSIENVECKPEEAFGVLGEKIIFASGSPFGDVDLGNGKIGHSNHAKNIYLFPGIGLGTLLSGARIVSDGMFQAAAERLALYMTEEEVLQGIIYPPVSRIREITKEVATAVVREAVLEEQADGYRYMSAHELSRLSQAETSDYVKNNMWSPAYPT